MPPQGLPPPQKSSFTVNRAVSLILVGFLLLACVAFLFDLFSTGMPFRPGQTATYRVTETVAAGKMSYTVRFSLAELEDGKRMLTLNSKYGTRSLAVDEALRPLQPGEQLRLPLSTKQNLAIDGLWLTREARERSSQLVPLHQESWGMWRVVKIPSLSGGDLRYELDTGLLVGFEADLGPVKVEMLFLSLK